MLSTMLPLSNESYTRANVLLRGVELGCIKVHMQTVCLKSDLVSGFVQVGVLSQRPVEGVDLILGNDLAGGKVFLQPVVVDAPE